MTEEINVSIVIPLFNESESLPELHRWIQGVMQTHSLSYEVIFIDAVNAKNTAGMTLLDYIHFNLKKGVFATADSKIQVGKVRKCVCEHGGVYSKYPEQRCN